MQWHNREKDWYNAERRFIFSTPNPKMLRKWITLIEKDKKRTIAKTNSQKNTRIGIKVQKPTPFSARSGKIQKRFGDVV